MSAKRTPVNLRDLLYRQVDAETAKLIKEIENDPKMNTPVFSDTDKVHMGEVGKVVLKELEARVSVEKHGLVLFCSNNPENGTRQFTGMYNDHPDVKITALFGTGRLIIVTEKGDLTGLAAATEVDGNLHVTVNDPVFVDKPVTLVFDIGGKDPNKAMHYGDVVGEETKDLSGEVSDMPNMQIAINRAAALITMILARAA